MRDASDVPRPGTIFYDGACGLCHAFVRFVVRRDHDGAFRFAPLGGPTFVAEVPEAERFGLPDSVVVRTADARVLARTPAVLHVLRRFGRWWRFVAAVLRVIPRPIRDFGYDRVAAIRRRVFAAPSGVCPVVPPHLRGRFLD